MSCDFLKILSKFKKVYGLVKVYVFFFCYLILIYLILNVQLLHNKAPALKDTFPMIL